MNENNNPQLYEAMTETLKLLFAQAMAGPNTPEQQAVFNAEAVEKVQAGVGAMIIGLAVGLEYKYPGLSASKMLRDVGMYDIIEDVDINLNRMRDIMVDHLNAKRTR